MDYTVYYRNGHVEKITPEIEGPYYESRDIINGANSIVSDGVKHDLTDADSIRSIKTPDYNAYVATAIGEELGVTGFLEYVLRMRAGLYWSDANYSLSISCLGKATELMKYSNMGWLARDFFRIVNDLNDIGYLKLARKWKDWIESNIPGTSGLGEKTVYDQADRLAVESFQEKIKSCEELRTDLIEIGDVSGCCEKCAKYRKRVYSLNGLDKRFPKFPYDDFHFGCGLGAWPYIYEVFEPSFQCDDVISYSNRPFVDDRTIEEKAGYEVRLEKIGAEGPIIREPNASKIAYNIIRLRLPEYAPKTFSGFMRMKNANSEKYRELVEKSREIGFAFPETVDDVWAWPHNK